MKIQSQYYNGKKWVTIANPYGFNHKVTSYLTVGFDKPCEGKDFYHYRTIGASKVDGVDAPLITSDEITANCGI